MRCARLRKAKFLPRTRDFERDGGYPPALFTELAQLGLMGMTAPEELGGAGADQVFVCTLTDRAGGGGWCALDDRFHPEQHHGQRPAEAGHAGHSASGFLPGLIGGQTIGCFALTESEAGSDASAIRTRAVRTEGGWHLSGSKQFITSGRIAGLAMVIAVTDAQAGKKGITAFLVPTNSPGFVVERVEEKLGQGASDTCALRFDDVFVPDDLVLGDVGRGYGIALANLETGRIGIAAQAVGMAQAALEIAVAYAKDRRSMGFAIIEHQAVGFRLADLAARLEAARHLVLHAASLKDAERPCLKEASMAKLVASETAEAICSGAIQTLGGYGYLEDYGLAKIYRDVKVCQIYEGTSDIQRMVIARAL